VMPVTALRACHGDSAALHPWSQPSSALDTPEPPFDVVDAR
jgi:hypothetical protein